MPGFWLWERYYFASTDKVTIVTVQGFPFDGVLAVFCPKRCRGDRPVAPTDAMSRICLTAHNKKWNSQIAVISSFVTHEAYTQ